MVDNMSSHLVKEAKKYQEQLNSASLTEKIEALTQFEKIGLPDKKDETWKYSNLTHINNIKYNSFKDKKNKYTSSNQDSTINVEDGKYNLTKKLKNNDDLVVNDLDVVSHASINTAYGITLNNIEVVDGVKIK